MNIGYIVMDLHYFTISDTILLGVNRPPDSLPFGFSGGFTIYRGIPLMWGISSVG